MAVLDYRFKVRGTTGLKVVDASIFPKIPRFYISLPIYRMSEKAAEPLLRTQNYEIVKNKQHEDRLLLET